MGKPKTGQPASVPTWRWVSECGLRLLTGGNTLALHAQLGSQKFPEIEDIIPADGSLLLVLRRGAGISPELRFALEAPLRDRPVVQGRLTRVAVRYGGRWGPDLAALADSAGLSQDEWIARHAAAEYRVAFLGFQPGFPYLTGLPDALRAPRRAEPRIRVPAGSVAIGGAYAGIYPQMGPGGWQLVGRTEITLFDPQSPSPALFAPGDRVRFEVA